MNILITGAFGNVGIYTLNNLLNRDHSIRVLELKNKKNLKILKNIEKKAPDQKLDIIWGDITDSGCVKKAVAGQDMIIHQAFVIPSLSEEKPNWAWEINVEGTRNILKAARECGGAAKIVFISYMKMSLKSFLNLEKNLKKTRKFNEKNFIGAFSYVICYTKCR